MEEKKNNGPLLESLAGQVVTAICFVQDYVEIHFEGPILTAYEWPLLFRDDGSFTESSPFYRHNLCGLIAARVVKTREEQDRKLILAFDNHQSIEIPIDPSSLSSVEAAMLVDSTRKKIHV